MIGIDILDILNDPEKYSYVNANVINECNSILIYYYGFREHIVVQSNIFYVLSRKGFFNEGIEIEYSFTDAEKDFTINNSIELIR